MSVAVLKEEILECMAARFPPPWIVGWWEGDERFGVEATKRLGPKRHQRVFGTGKTWRGALIDLLWPGSMPP